MRNLSNVNTVKKDLQLQVISLSIELFTLVECLILALDVEVNLDFGQL